MTRPPEARVTRYDGVTFRSALEANWAASLNYRGMRWEYEQHLFQLPSGVFYLPDFWLPDLRTYIEVKGTGVPRTEKPAELAKEIDDETIVLLGFSPARRSLAPYEWGSYMLWRDLAGYDARLAKCASCDGWQWLRAELSRNCRLCGTFHRGFLAKPGELEFQAARPDLWWLARF